MNDRRDGTPIYSIRGAETDADEDIDTDTGAAEDDGEEDAGGEWTPPSREEWERVQAALTKANNEAKRRRLQGKQKPANKPAAAEEGDADAQAAAEARYKPVAVRAAARAAFMDAGLNDASAERVRKLLRLVDMDEVELDDDGDITGLDDQIEEIKADYPELFTKPDDRPAPTKRAPRINGSNRQAAGARTPTSAERMAARLSGR